MWKLIQPIENLLRRWSGKFLSYGNRISLVNWVIAGKYTYWVQGTPSLHQYSVVKKTRKLANRFIWDGRKGITWKQVILKSEGWFGFRDLPIIIRAVNVNGAEKFWNKSESILFNWIQQRIKTHQRQVSWLGTAQTHLTLHHVTGYK